MSIARRLLAYKDGRRKNKNRVMISLLSLASLVAIFPLLNVFIYLLQQGAPAINLDFFTHIAKPVGEVGGGMANAILGTGILILLASSIGIPLGIAAGVYLSEYQSGKISKWLRFSVDMLTSVPSIIIGIFTYAILVKPLKHFSALAGGIALAIIMLPVIARTTEEILKLVPQHVREAGLALGIPRWKVILFIVVRGSIGGLTTGIMLAVARAAGETAPLLFTAFSSQYWPKGLMEPIASLPVQIYTYAISPYDDWHRQAWAAAFVLVSFVFLMNIFTRILLRAQPTGRD